ncbi:MAG: hypothetical protein B1H04_01530 [Planctomycetales bacterium 4484_123]|nr:MAG: hypothetical protein B1H04_01530 [Planctomycetales bacterium 4484_123]
MTAAWKIYLLVLCFLVLSVALLAGFQSLYDARDTLRQLRHMHRLYARIAASQVEAGYYEKIWPFEMLDAISHDDNVVFWRVADGEGRTVLTDKPLKARAEETLLRPEVARDLSGPTLVSGPGGRREIWIVPMRMRTGGEPWTFQLCFHTKRIRQRIRSIIVTDAVLALCISIVLVPISVGLTRRFLRPLTSLTAAADEMTRGNLEVSLPPAGTDEIGRLVRAFQAMVNGIKARDAEIRRKLHALQEANERIRQAQAELVQSEKMSMLGQLVAGVAHEINTPTGAILNVSVDVPEHIRGLATAVSDVARLPVETRQWLAAIAERLLESEVVAESQARARRRELQRQLRRAGVSEHRRLAGVLAECGLGLAEQDRCSLERLSDPTVLSFLDHLVALRKASEISRVSAEKIARIVRALRYYSRPDQGERFDIDIRESIDNTLVILQNRIKHVATVETDYGEAAPIARCGADISQVWTNILTNACDAIEENRGEEMGRIRITTRVENGQVVTEMANSGPPIPEELMAKLYDPFFTTKPIGRGTGLGLSICVGILRRYGGSISARNEPDGVVFTVSLPAAGEREAEAVSVAAVADGGE